MGNLLDQSRITPDQNEAIDRLYSHDETFLYAKPGSGKTIIAATAIKELLDDGHLSRVLIISTPKIVKTVWPGEFRNWRHTQHITVDSAVGDVEQRLSIFKDPAIQVVVATFNVLPWIKANKLFDSFDGLVIDESTKLTQTGGAQFRALRPNLKKFKWRVALSGTPCAESFDRLFGQMLLVDLGKSLGTRKESFMQEYFYTTDFKGYNWTLKEGSAERITKAVDHLVHTVPDYRGDLPELQVDNHYFSQSEEVLSFYNTLRKDLVCDDVTAVNAAVLVGKLQQVASGFVYTDTGEVVSKSDNRIQALTEAMGKTKGPVIVTYNFKEDLRRLKEYFGAKARELKPSNLEETTSQWNEGEVEVLLIHPRSAGHGLNLAKGGCVMIHYTPHWSWDVTDQANARLWRRGQTKTVQIITLVALGTVDELIVQRIENKKTFDMMFNEHLGVKK